MSENDLGKLFHAQDVTARWRAEHENASARLELAQRNERAAFLLSQNDPVAKMGVERGRLRLLLDYLKHGDIGRLNRDFEALQDAERG